MFTELHCNNKYEDLTVSQLLKKSYERCCLKHREQYYHNNRKEPYISTEKNQYHRNSVQFNGLKYTTVSRKEKNILFATRMN